MSTLRDTVIFLAGELAEAVSQDEHAGDGFDLSAGLFGTHVSNWVYGVAELITGEKSPVLPTPTGTRCSVCLAPQFDTPSCTSCPNGHGGADSLEGGI
jgi:hypothetical protein